MTTETITPRTVNGRTPVYMHIAAWAIPVLLLGGFAMIALVPVLVVLIASCTDLRVRYLRWWAIAVATFYAVPLVIMNVRPDPAPSLTKDMHPALLVLAVAAAAALLLRMYLRRRVGSAAREAFPAR
jgi:hypothetical protein